MSSTGGSSGRVAVPGSAPGVSAPGARDEPQQAPFLEPEVIAGERGSDGSVRVVADRGGRGHPLANAHQQQLQQQPQPHAGAQQQRQQPAAGGYAARFDAVLVRGEKLAKTEVSIVTKEAPDSGEFVVRATKLSVPLWTVVRVELAPAGPAAGVGAADPAAAAGRPEADPALVEVRVRCFPGRGTRRVDVVLRFRSAREAAAFAGLVAPGWAPDRLAIVLNNHAGKRKGEKIFARARGVFAAAGCDCDVFRTDRPQFGVGWARTADLSRYSAVICVSGDSTLTEVLNGIDAREDRDQLRAIPLGMLAAGSTNALMKSFGATDPVVAALRAMRGALTPLDVMRIRHGHVQQLALNNVGFGLLGELNGYAEEWTSVRHLGPVRYVAGACRALCSFHPFLCRMRWRERHEPERPLGILDAVRQRARQRELRDRGVRIVADGDGRPEEPVEGDGEEHDEKSRLVQTPVASDAAPVAPVAPPPAALANGDDLAVDPDAGVRELDVAVANVMVVSFATPFTPKASMSDGILDLSVVHMACCCTVLGLMGCMACGRYGSKRVNLAQFSHLRLDEIAPATSRLNIDGEVVHVVDGQSLDVEVVPAYFVFLAVAPQ